MTSANRRPFCPALNVLIIALAFGYAHRVVKDGNNNVLLPWKLLQDARISESWFDLPLDL